jgi:hypothetical protein
MFSFCAFFFRYIPSGNKNIYFAGLGRISISLPSPLFVMIPPYPNKEHAREGGKNGFTGGHERDNGPAFETKLLSLSPAPCPRLTELQFASLRASAILKLSSSE